MIHCSNTEDTPTVIDAQVCAQMWQTPICTVMLRYALTHSMYWIFDTHYVYCHTRLCFDTHYVYWIFDTLCVLPYSAMP